MDIKSVIPLLVGERENLKCDSASIYFSDGDQCAEVHGNIAAMPDPISAKDMAEYIVTAVNSHDALVEALAKFVKHFGDPFRNAKDALKLAGVQ